MVTLGAEFVCICGRRALVCEGNHYVEFSNHQVRLCSGSCPRRSEIEATARHERRAVAKDFEKKAYGKSDQKDFGHDTRKRILRRG